MLRLLCSKSKYAKIFFKTSEPCHVGIHWIALAGGGGGYKAAQNATNLNQWTYVLIHAGLNANSK